MKKSKLKKQHAKMYEDLVMIKNCSWDPEISPQHQVLDLKNIAEQCIKKIDKKQKSLKDPSQAGWEEIFDMSKKKIKSMVGDIECGSEAMLMLNLMEDYDPPQKKKKLEDTHTGITLDNK